jgi:hypothetical protein
MCTPYSGLDRFRVPPSPPERLDKKMDRQFTRPVPRRAVVFPTECCDIPVRVQVVIHMCVRVQVTAVGGPEGDDPRAISASFQGCSPMRRQQPRDVAIDEYYYYLEAILHKAIR